MVYLSAGHHSQAKNIKQDPGAVNKHNVKEGDLTIEFRNLIAGELDLLGVKYGIDSDEESLSIYLARIQTGTGSVVLEIHFDASDNATATGCTGLIEGEADRLDRAFAKELTDANASILGIKNRGVISETESHRGRLGLMREEGIICLQEICFISNDDDLRRYHLKKKELAKAFALIIQKYEAMLS